MGVKSNIVMESNDMLYSQESISKKENNDHSIALLLSIAIHVIMVLLCLVPYFTDDQQLDNMQRVLVVFGDDNIESRSTEIQKTENLHNQLLKNETVLEKELEKDDLAESIVGQNRDDKKDYIQNTKTNGDQTDMANVNEKSPFRNDAKTVVDRISDEKQDIIEKNKPEELGEIDRKYESSKKQFGNLFNNQNKDTNNSSNGDPMGEPDEKALNDMVKNSHSFSGNLSSRKIIYQPKITDNSQKVGKVVIHICVDQQGIVSSANYTQKGSTSSDKSLIILAENAAKKYRFSPANFESQCGNLTIDFRLGT